MNRYLKTSLISLLSFAIFLAIGSGIVSYFFQNEVIGFVIESINKQVSSRIEVRSAHFSVFRKFPNAAVEFRHVVMSPAKDFDTLSFAPEHSRHLLTAKSVFAEMNLFRLLTGNYRITRVELRDGSVNLLSDQNNRHNFIFWKTSDEPTAGSSPIELQNVTLRNVDVYYGHRQSNTVVSLYAERAHLSGRFSSLRYSMNADWHGAVHLFSLDDDLFIRDKDLELSGKLDVHDNIFAIRRCELTIAKVKTTISGGFSTGEELILDLQVEGKQMDYASLASALPDAYGQKLHEYPGKGDIDFEASIQGKAGNGEIPKIEGQFGMSQGQIAHRHSKTRVTGLSFHGTFTTGERNRRSTSMLQISEFDCNIGGGSIKGNLTIQNFARPQITARISSTTDLGQLLDFFPLQQFASAGGGMRCELTAKVRLKNLTFSKTEDVEQLELNGTVRFSNAWVNLREPAYRISNINGSLQVANRVSTNNLSLAVNGNNLNINGYMERWSPYLLKRSKTMFFKANVSSQLICVESLLRSSASSPSGASNVAREIAAPLLPANIEFDAHFDAAKFRYQKFEAEQMKAHLVYLPRILEIRSMTFASMSGKLTGNGAIANNQANHLQLRGEMTLDRMQVSQLFHAFDNFGQDALRAEHVKGTLSGDMGFAVGWDNRMQLQQDRIAVESLLNLSGGELLNFEPMNNLSRFVALEELQNIRFSNLDMRVSVKNGKITIPQTDIRTSAFDIMSSGEHYFDNRYTYRVKILLSELLAAKARRAKRENRENEYIEDGGKRTALYLKVEGQGDEFKIGYDTQSAKASIAQDIRNERQTLKTILNEEFGWFKRDTLLKPKTPDNSGRLRFTFDED